LNPSYYNFTQWVYEEWDIGYYTCPDYEYSNAVGLSLFSAAVSGVMISLTIF
jgi:hypothetical protein